MTNHKPHADANDKAFWTRGCLIEFGLRFVSDPKAKNERKADPDLKETLKREASGILAWLVRGCLEWQIQGLKVPEAVRIATEQYQKEEDGILLFIEECCIEGKGKVAKAQLLYRTYAAWCKENQLSAMNGKLFGELMSKKYQKVRKEAGIVYEGIGILTTNVPPGGQADDWKESDESEPVGSLDDEPEPYSEPETASEADSGDTPSKKL